MVYLVVEADGLAARLLPTPPEKGLTAVEIHPAGDLTLWLAGLGKAGVSHGVDQELLERLARGEQPLDRPLTIARATPPIADGNMEKTYHFEFVATARAAGQDERVDLKRRNFGLDVHEGQLLAEQVDQGKGQAGTDVLGRPLPPPPPADRLVIQTRGEVRETREGNRTCYYAKVNGVLLNGEPGLVHVERELKIAGDVDYSTGDLSTQVPIRIRGSVIQGFAVRSGALVEIGGHVERKALVESRGDIKVGKGAAEEAWLKAEGSLRVGFAHGAILEAGVDVAADSYLHQCRVKARGRILVNAKRGSRSMTGAVVGGELNAIAGMELVSVGSPSTLTTLICGFDAAWRAALAKAESLLREAETDLSRILRRAGVNLLASRPGEAIKALSDPSQRPLVREIAALQMRRKALGSQVGDLKSRPAPEIFDAPIKVTERLIPDVLVVLNACKTIFKVETGPCIIREKDGGVQVSPS